MDTQQEIANNLEGKHVATVRHSQMSQSAVQLLHCMNAQISVCFRILVCISVKKLYTIWNKCKTPVVLAVRIKYLRTPQAAGQQANWRPNVQNKTVQFSSLGANCGRQNKTEENHRKNWIKLTLCRELVHANPVERVIWWGTKRLTHKNPSKERRTLNYALNNKIARELKI